MNVRQLIDLLAYLPPDLPVTVLASDGNELPLRGDDPTDRHQSRHGCAAHLRAATPTITREGGGAAPEFVAINVLGASK